MILTENLVEFLLGTPEIQALVAAGTIGSDVKYPRGYIFEGKPYAKIDDLNRSSTVVISSSTTWDAPVRGNSLRFPLVIIEIWAAPSKNTDGTVAEFDADDVISEVYDAIRKYVHLVHRSPVNGAHFEWGSSVIVDSQILKGPENRNILNFQGGRMGIIEVGVSK